MRTHTTAAGRASSSGSLGFVAVMMLEIDKLATHLDRLVQRFGSGARRLLHHAARLRRRGMRAGRSQLAGVQEVVDRLGVVFSRKQLAEPRQLVVFLFLRGSKGYANDCYR